MKKLLCSLTVLSLWSMTACDEIDEMQKSEESEETEEGEPSGGDATGVDPDGGTALEPVWMQKVEDQDIFGTWVGPCSNDGASVLIFEPNNWAQAVFTFAEGSDCQGQAVATWFWGGESNIVEISEDGLASWDGTVSSFQKVYYEEDLVQGLNQIAYHGYDDWVAGEAKECINRPSQDGEQAVLPHIIYSSIRITNDGKLALGSSGFSAEERGTDVDVNKAGGPYVRQQ